MKFKKILSINSVNYGSTGNIMLDISKMATDNGFETVVAYPKSRTNNKKRDNKDVIISNLIERNLHLKLSYYTGYNGCFSHLGTRKFLRNVDKIKPDIIHLHNLHNSYINLEMLFRYIKEKRIPTVWTLHDCWAFTGQCSHYSIVKCDKWISGCYDCPQYREYPTSRIDRTKEMYSLKKNWFTEIPNLTIVTPSNWLRNQVKESFLKDYPIKVINNGIDLSIFKPRKSNFRDSHNLNHKVIILGVANPWSNKKGLDVFVELSKRLSNKYSIVLVGLTNSQISKLPMNMIGLPKTNNQVELAELYSAADIFVNPSLEETMGLVTVEALACGTPVIVSSYTAVPEVVSEYCGEIVNGFKTEDYFDAITNFKVDLFSVERCLEQAEKYDKTKTYEEYILIYSQVTREESQNE